MERAAGHLTPLRPDSLQLVRDAWIQSKYEKKLFIDQRWNAPDQLPENALCLPESGQFPCQPSINSQPNGLFWNELNLLT